MDSVEEATYWNQRYIDKQDFWDMNSTSPPLTDYLDSISNKNLRILFPGAGKSHDAYYAYKAGFLDTTICDFSQVSKDAFLEKFPDFPEAQFIVGNFFDLQDSYDLILEQTFFCAINPNQRNQYVQKMHQLLDKGGRLAGVLFKFPLTEQGSPFGGSHEEYQNRFEELFHIHILEPCENSINPRAGKELFFELEKKN